MKNHYQKLTLTLVFISGLMFASAQTTRYAGTYSELTTAIANSAASGDIIQITNNIVVTAQVIINKSLTIYGNGYTITVPNPGLDEMGRFNSSASTHRVFNFNTAVTSVVINNLTIKGGNVSAAGGAIWISSTTAKLTLNYCTISNSRTSGWVGGGAIYNQGVLFINGCYIKRNAAEFGGGLLNDGVSAKTYFESSTLIENRVTSGSGGGGAVENKGGATMYFNNSTLSNNQAPTYGGAINNYNSTLYFINSSATGNVVYDSPGGCKGGVILNLNSSAYFYAANSLFAYNYKATGGTSSNPSNFVLDDVIGYYIPADNGRVFFYHCVHHADLPGGIGASVSNIQYTGNINGSDNSIFSDGILSKITDNDGNEIGDAIYRPFLYNNEGSVAPTLKSGSFVLQTTNRGTRTRYANNNNVSPVVAYYNGSSYVDLAGTSSSGQEVLVDQVGDARPDPPARGAIEGEVDNLYMVKVLASANGTVSGGTFYGDIYPEGASVTLTAIPTSTYEFTSYDYVLGGSGTASTDNPYTFTVTADVTLQPVFSLLPTSNYSITYVGNGNTGGTAPANVTFSGSTTIAGAGDLAKTGYTFNGWNTNAYGSGTPYSVGATYSTSANLTLYAQWTQETTWNWTGAASSTWGTTSNWSKSDQSSPSVPTSTDNVNIPNVANDPVLAFDATASCKNLTIADGASFTIQSTASGTGSLITTGTATGKVTIERFIPGSSTLTQNKYHFVAIPTQYANPTSNLFLGSYLYKLDPSQQINPPANPAYGKWVALGTSTTTELQTNQGYMIYYPGASTTYTFEGNLNNGTYDYSLTGHPGAGVHTFNLIPNPYPSAVVWNTGGAGWTKSEGIGGTCYIWNASTGNYTSVPSAEDAYIPVGQAFMVLVSNEALPALAVNNNARVHSSQVFYKSASEIDNRLVIKANSNNYADETVVKFTTEATEQFDLQTDGMKLFGYEDAPQLYTLSGNEKYSINNLPVITDQKVVPMNFETQFTGEVSLTFANIESFTAGLNLYLQDLLTGQTINLRNQQVYTFNHQPENPANRFELIFGGTIGIEEQAAFTGKMWIFGNTLYINTPKLEAEHGLLEAFDATGKLLLCKNLVLGELTTHELPFKGFVAIRLTKGNEVMTTKGVLIN